MKAEVLDTDSDMLKDFKHAYARLKDHKPENVENIELMRVGKLRINKLTLAREACHSRTNYLKHDDILKYAESKIGSRPRVTHEAPDIEGANRELRSQNRSLQKDLDDMRTQNAELISYIHFLEKEHKVVVRDTLSENPFMGSIAGRARKNPAAVRDMSKRAKLGKSGKDTG
ncbi:hypothetical protein B0G71_0718 [Paraburkholderia sp. BL27I4N3]|uniref:hypothetical protein n=1 Tax=Paraburkholderia sp. BL27I4N3 TaxID=1938805 RepID=UPI000E267CDD|nr:hypothetical protein [Paraburkholderia sp. BL27I4N3]REE17752.1 hypothetical protein B0G71_0718 [Paraburkholderia sp. BL27I4N3]